MKIIITENQLKKLIPNNSIINSLLKRIPFFKEYNMIEINNDRLELNKFGYYSNIKLMIGDELFNFKNYNISSDFFYYTDKINDNIFHYFILKNDFHITKPNNMDDILFRTFIIGNKILSEKLSLNKEIRLKENEDFNDEILSKIINDINGKLFEIENFSEKHHIKLF